MGIVEIGRIKSKLRGFFEGKVDLSDSTDAQAAFLTRSLGAFAVFDLCGCTTEQAAQSVTDGPKDGGIDALFYDRATKKLYLVQSKWHEKGNGTIDQGEVLKFLGGFERIVKQGDTSEFNAKIRSKQTDIDEAVKQTDTHFVLVLCHTGTQGLSPEVVAEIDKIRKELNDLDDNMVSLEVFDQRRTYDSAMGSSRTSTIKLTLQLIEWGRVASPYTAYYGQVAVSEIASWKQYGSRLFDSNLRRVLPASEVNDRIRKTLELEGKHFWYFNNGITILCQAVDKTRIGGDRRDSGSFECSGVAIVNGAQTVGAIWASTTAIRPGSDQADARVLVRLIDLRDCPKDFGREVTRNTNTQNRILGRDFVSMDPVQERLARELDADGIKYTYKAGDTISEGDSQCDLSDAAVALACASGNLQLAVYAKREISVLWDDIDNAAGTYRSLFNDSLQATHLWRAVQILRAVDSELMNYYAGPDRLIAIHGNRFISHCVFRDPEVVRFRDLNVHLDVLKSRAKAVARGALQQAHSFILNNWISSYPQAIFKNATKCQELRDGMGPVVPIDRRRPTKDSSGLFDQTQPST